MLKHTKRLSFDTSRSLRHYRGASGEREGCAITQDIVEAQKPEFELEAGGKVGVHTVWSKEFMMFHMVSLYCFVRSLSDIRRKLLSPTGPCWTSPWTSTDRQWCGRPRRDDVVVELLDLPVVGMV